MLDLFDHGPLLMVINGQFVAVDDLSLNIERDYDTVHSSHFDEGQVVQTGSTISVSLTTKSAFKHSGVPDCETIRLYNKKHELLFKDSIISQWTYDGDVMEIEFVSMDYDASDDWYSRFSS
ncbi:hypothetical protein M199_gp045 [Halogranum tailed virus 1]|uniref:Uncharacterized protein n=1 Tax=Halogranum tailed virus 1 TaxID=1273749 RepID=R4T8Z9_9CAUD|nr:hypothetical protein M199_gp045 [Halogranum tailed virus 1]AGM11375.1 hypothetical protein HGTV1_45 [Halogranum tailed virus 1]